MPAHLHLPGEAHCQAHASLLNCTSFNSQAHVLLATELLVEIGNIGISLLCLLVSFEYFLLCY